MNLGPTYRVPARSAAKLSRITSGSGLTGVFA